ncbi:hypothetical protein Ddye_017832 [Dipteronia dyeriana]|uniref:Proliferating cell nuclear antigen PCNA N-terminal domain-containing protein n=1 Tax=Dipteronia dyeriana TaxID=168575 RepID=A0AAD9X1B2_9ROSI|nr:hypothetical protein Ddye_017832 [Dipteronia dyeriana]
MSMTELRFKRAIDLKRSLKPLTSLAQTATVIYSADSVSLLVTIPDGHVIAALRILSTEFDHFRCREGAATGFDIDRLYRYLHFFSIDNMYVTIGAVDDDGGKFQVVMQNTGIAVPYILFNMRLIQPNDDHINFENQERKYDVKVGIPAANFREMIASLAQRLSGTIVVTITSSEVRFGVICVYCVLLQDILDCVIEGDTCQSPIHLHLRLDNLISIGEEIVLSEMVWIYGSRSAPPMLNCLVPPIGELMYYFV